jgi:hypothetical protein
MLKLPGIFRPVRVPPGCLTTREKHPYLLASSTRDHLRRQSLVASRSLQYKVLFRVADKDVGAQDGRNRGLGAMAAQWPINVARGGQ